MDVVFLSPAWPPEMARFAVALAHQGARVHGVGDSGDLPADLARSLSSYLRVPSMMREDDVIERVLNWLGGRVPDRIETNWEAVTLLAARLRGRLGVPGTSLDVALRYRDKDKMKAAVRAAGLPTAPAVRVTTLADAWRAAEHIGFPLVVKPVDGAGGADTHIVDSPGDLHGALRAMRHVPEVLVEAFVTGDELTYEAMLVDGEPVFESVSQYFPNALTARRNAWISPIIFTHAQPHGPATASGVHLGRAVNRALGLASGATHLEWFRAEDGSATFGEAGARTPGAAMIELMCAAFDRDLCVDWARVALGHPVSSIGPPPFAAAAVFKRAEGEGHIVAHHGLEAFLQAFGDHVVDNALLPVGAPRRDWRQTFVGDGYLLLRHPDPAEALRIAKLAASRIQLVAR